MPYLEQYRDVKEQRHDELESKHTKVRVGDRKKEVPNFDVIHHRQMQEMDEARVECRHLTRPKPFNLSQNRPIKEQPLHYHIDL